MDIVIKPLDAHTLSDAIVLRDQVFPNLSKSDHATLTMSINPQELYLYQKLGIKTLDYWIAVMDEHIVGLVGLYTQREVNEDSVWLGWYCVDSQYRGHKIGSKLFNFAIDEAKNRHHKYLHLYTTADEEYAAAREQYHKIGFEQYKSKSSELYYKLHL